MLSLTHRLYYPMKPWIPRMLQILAREKVVRWLRMRNTAIWPINVGASDPPEQWKGWPEGKRFALVLTHDVESQKGLNRCLDLASLEERLGFRSAFYFVAEDYDVPRDLREELTSRGFEVGLHGLSHDCSLFRTKKTFMKQAVRINQYLKEWGCAGFRSPAMHRNMEWIQDLEVEYDASTFDTDPFEPQPDGVNTIFPFMVGNGQSAKDYVELPYTLPQDFMLYVIMKERSIEIWKRKLAWISECGGMALLLTHPDYMNFNAANKELEEYPLSFYEQVLFHLRERYTDEYWHALPREVARFWKVNYPSHSVLPARKAKAKCPLVNEGKMLKSAAPSRPSEGLQENNRLAGDRTAAREPKKMMKIWIDLDNSPHVPFFIPIKKELEKRGHSVFVTTRDCFQVCGLADYHQLDHTTVGKHYGANKLAKVAGTLWRSLELMPVVIRQRPDLSLSHGSRSLLLLSSLLRIPSVLLFDYEHANRLPLISTELGIVPEMIDGRALTSGFKSGIRKYRGLKEDVYVPSFTPDPSILREIGIVGDPILVTIRPPATEAHYHNRESERLFYEVVEFLGGNSEVRMVILPRNEKKQGGLVYETWPEWCRTGKIIVPDHAVNGLNLIWHSDFVVSGGGTMNREAAAMGVPVYSIFRGKIGAVDRYLSDTGRLTLLETPEQVRSKIQVVKRTAGEKGEFINKTALEDILAAIEETMQNIRTH